MFEWLVDEMASVATQKFFLVDGPASPNLRAAVEASSVPVPPSYKEFVLRFGNAKLYRYSTNYYISIFAGPREMENPRGEAFLQIGRTWTSLVCFNESLLEAGAESPVFESSQDQGIQQTAESFEQWLQARCTAARKRFTEREWRLIGEGPRPFSERERGIVQARKLFRWRVVGIADNGDLQFEVYNSSSITLPYLSVGIRHKEGEAIGRVMLPIAYICPGDTRVIEMDCYKKWHHPTRIEAVVMPDPGPEDREFYWEFRAK